MNHFEAFSCLGIPITKDISAIKKAYQMLISQHHPEEDPQGFMLLHEAYKTALAYARGTSTANTSSGRTFWQPEETHSSRDETGYDNLFADLGREQTADVAQQKKDFTRKLLELKLHWLPIPLKHWHRFFSSEVFQLCRGEPECMEQLFELLVRKIHTYGAFRFLLNRLWELNSWQTSEDKEALANKTRNCITELRKQYSHYLKLDPAVQSDRLIFPAFWYYQALPFYFKLIVSTLLLPLISFGSVKAIILLLLAFYVLELCTWLRKSSRKLGIFHPTLRKEKGGLRLKCIGESDFLIIITINLILLHFFGCIAFIMD